ncbi:MAG: DUF167 family protein [Beijerinckiaceae bacterium]
MTAQAAPWRIAGDDVLVAVRAVPRGGRDAIDGIEQQSDGRAVLKIRIRAAPADGEANEALRRFLAKALKWPASKVSLDSGATARQKMMRISGGGAAIIAALDALTRA